MPYEEFERATDHHRVTLTTEDAVALLRLASERFGRQFDAPARMRLEVERHQDSKVIDSFDDLESELSTGNASAVTGLYMSCSTTGLSMSVRFSDDMGAYARADGLDLVKVAGLTTSTGSDLARYAHGRRPTWGPTAAAAFLGVVAGFSIGAVSFVSADNRLLYGTVFTAAPFVLVCLAMAVSFTELKWLFPPFELRSPGEASKWVQSRTRIYGAAGVLAVTVIGAALLALLGLS